jgi:hypothetical protein
MPGINNWHMTIKCTLLSSQRPDTTRTSQSLPNSNLSKLAHVLCPLRISLNRTALRPGFVALTREYITQIREPPQHATVSRACRRMIPRIHLFATCSTPGTATSRSGPISAVSRSPRRFPGRAATPTRRRSTGSPVRAPVLARSSILGTGREHSPLPRHNPLLARTPGSSCSNPPVTAPLLRWTP